VTTRARLLLAALFVVVACDKQKPQRTAVPSKPQRIAVPKRGAAGSIAGNPLPEPELVDVFSKATLVPIADAALGAWSGIDTGGETLWIGPMIDRLADGHEGRTALAIRRAAFGRRVPAAGERADIDDDPLLDAGYADERRLVVLIGPESQCIAARGQAQLIAEVAGGHVLDLRWRLEGCGGGPWAPIGLLVDRQPTQLRWRGAACPEPEPIAKAWASARPERDGWTELGALMIGDEPHALVGHDGVRGVLLVAPRSKSDAWTTLVFDAAGLSPVRHGCAPAPAPEPAEAAISPRASAD
jgi:hypothetical protein